MPTPYDLVSAILFETAYRSYQAQNSHHRGRRSLKSEVRVVVAGAVAVGVVAVTVVEAARKMDVAVDRDSGCSRLVVLAVGIVPEEGSSIALAFVHGSGRLQASEGVQAGGCGIRDSKSAGAVGAEEHRRRTWRSAARSCAAAERGWGLLPCARGLEGWKSGQHLPATAASTAGWCRSEA
jgi:hypothetical protein